MKSIIKGLYIEKLENGYAVFAKRDNEYVQLTDDKYSRIWNNYGTLMASVGKYITILDKKTAVELLPDDIYILIGDNQLGRRVCKREDGKCAIMINFKIYSDWYDNIKVYSNFNVVTNNGVQFITNGNCTELLSDQYKKIGPFARYDVIDRSYANVIGVNGKCGTLDCEGYEGISCEYENVHNFTSIFRIVEFKLTNGKSTFSLMAINGEIMTKDWYVDYKITHSRLKMTTPDGKVDIFNAMGQKVKK